MEIKKNYIISYETFAKESYWNDVYISKNDTVYAHILVDQLGESILALKVRVSDTILTDIKKAKKHGETHSAKALFYIKINRRDLFKIHVPIFFPSI